MTSANDFSRRITTAPIYISSEKKDDELLQNSHSISQKTNSTWQKWFQQVHNIVSQSQYYGNPSLLLNSDFDLNNSVPTPITQANGNGAFFSEKWQIFGASGANYTLTQTPFSNNDSDQTGSNTFINTIITSWDLSPFYLYQRQSGAQFLRRYQNRNIYLSTKVRNNLSTEFSIKFEVVFYLDTGQKLFSKSVIRFPEGISHTASLLKTDGLLNDIIGPLPYVDFRFTFIDFDSPLDFDIIYIKAEISDEPTPLYVDHALERVRVDNS